MPIYTKRCSQNTQKLSQVGGSSLYFSRFLSFTRYFLFLLPLASLFLLASCGGGGGAAGAGAADGDAGSAGSAADNLSIANSSVAENDRSINFTVSLPAAENSVTSFYYRTKDDSAVAGSDYRATSASASIASGATTTKISVVIINDDDIEDEESFFVEILRSSTADTVIATATATIKIDDLPSLSIAGASASEDAESLEFIVSLSAPFPGHIVSFDYQTIAGSATEGDDYTGVASNTASNTATIPAGDTQISVPISIVNDSIDEGTEVFELVISNPVNATISQASSALGTIKGEIASLFIADVSTLESAGVLKFIVTLDRLVNQTVYFDYETTPVSASFLDYTSAFGRASIPAGDTTAEIPIAIVDDQLVEDNESFFVEISNATSATSAILISKPRATVTIKIDELPTLSIAGRSVIESAGRLRFIARLSVPFPENIVSFDYETLSGSASRDLDYSHSTARASIKAGELITSIFVDLIDDVDVENDETFDLVISKLINATIDLATVTVIIKSDDLPSLTIANVVASEDVGTLQFVASLSEPFSADVSFAYETRAGSASAPSDYTSAFGRASILAGDTTTAIPIVIKNDDDIEAAESFDLVIANPLNATISKASATVTIKIDELPSLSITDATAFESARILTFRVSLSVPFPDDIVYFDYETLSGSASRDLDYTYTTARAVILAGETDTSIIIPISDDNLIETDETFDLVITNPINTTISKARATATIKTDDLPSLTIANVSASEDVGTLQFVVTLSEPFGADASFNYTTRAGSASAPSDYTSAFGRASILAGDTTTEIPIAIIDDDSVEADESFELVISNPLNATISKASATATIKIDELPSLSITDATAFESARILTFRVSLNEAFPGHLVYFDYETLSGSASSNLDYTYTTARAVILAGEKDTSIIIPISDDNLIETDETFDLVITNPINTTISKARATATIKNDDLPSLFIADATALESEPTLRFVVTLSEPVGADVSFDYATRAGSALAGSDYTSDSGRVSILAGATTTEIPIAIIQDIINEGDEVFELVVSNPNNALISRASATGTIRGAIASLFIADGSAFESEGSIKFSVTLSTPVTKDVSFDYATIPGGSALAGSDYTSASGNMTIKAGDTTAELEVELIDDAIPESNNSFFVDIGTSAPSTELSISKKRATATIKNDDLPALSIANTSVRESAGRLEFVVTLNQSSPSNVTFFYYTLDGSASADLDYVHSVGTTTILAGTESIKIPIGILDDDLVEADESFELVIASPANATIDKARATATIINDDLLTLSVADGSAFESEGSIKFSVTLSEPVGADVSFDYETRAGSASANSDYTSDSGRASILAGDTTAEIPIAIINDQLVEADESFELVITNSANATISKSSATATIKDDDVPALSIANTSALESAGRLEFVVILNQIAPSNVTFFYHTLDGSASAELDYVHSVGAATILAGTESIKIPISILDDDLVEANETFDLVIANPINATIATNRATATIQNDDTPSLSVVGRSALESARSLKFTVFLSMPITKDASFRYQTIAGSALATSDYTSVSDATSILAGSTSISIIIDLSADSLIEADETFDLVIFSPENAIIDIARATATIKNDDFPILSIADATALESAGSLEFVVSLSEAFPSNIVAFEYHTLQASAIADLDYTHSFASATISAGDTSTGISIAIIDDLLLEADESFDIIISNIVNATIDQARATGTIKSEDLVGLSVIGRSALESARSIQFTVFLSAAITKDVSFDYKTQSGSALATSDYTSVSDTTSIPAGSTSISIFVDLSDDTLVEDDESFELVIANPTNATIDIARATGTIKIEDLPTLSITDASAIEGTETLEFIASLSSPFPGHIVSFDYQTINGSAKNILDYTASFARVSISAGDSTTAIAIVIRNDSLIEDDESFDLVIANPTNANIDKPSATATIKNDDLPSLSITGSSVKEAAGSLRFIVRLSVPFLSTDVFFDYETIAGSALATSDYIGVSDTTSIPAGSSTAEIVIDIVKGDARIREGDEVFSLKLSNPVNATISKASALGIIEGLSTSLFIADATALESEQVLRFAVTLNNTYNKDLSVDYKTIAISASNDIDYTGVVAQTIIISRGDTTAEIIIDISNDTSIENDETFFVVISTSEPTADISISREQATGTIVNDDLPVLSIANVTTLENAGSLEFVASLSAPFPGHLVSFDYETLSGSASADLDYSSLLTTANIYSGDTTALISINILDDNLIEDDETFDLVISNLVNATISTPRATATIKIDELPSLTITDATAFEGDRQIKFSVSLSVPFLRADVSFDYATIAGSARANSDYTSDFGSASISAGDTTAELFIDLIDDALVEDAETFYVMLSNPVNATIDENKDRATATIRIDDIPSLSIIDTAAIESEGSIKFIARLNVPFPGHLVSFDYATLAGSASADSDYTSDFGSASIPAGDTTTEIAITINNDSLIEDDETFDLVITNPTNATIDRARATATIKIDDLPSLTITDATAFESDRQMKFSLSLSEAFANTDVSFDYETLAGSASAPSDYIYKFATARILAGDTTAELFIDLRDDDLTEDPETFYVMLSNPTNATIDRARATGTIQIDELPSLSIADATAVEATGSIKFTVTLNPSFASTDVSFDYATIAGSASATSDYTSASGRASIPAGDTTTELSITITDDSITEDPEIFYVVLSNPTNATIDIASATATIKNDDLPILSIADATAFEDTGSIKFTVTLNPSFASTDVFFYYETLAASASATSDYTSASGRTSILAGDTTTEIAIIITPDDSIEDPESFFLTISNPTNATIDRARATGTIQIDDFPTLSITDAAALEGTNMQFSVSLSKAFANTDVSFYYETIPITTTADADYISSSGTKIISATDTTTTITIEINSDSIVEGDEFVGVRLSRPVNATIKDGDARGIIDGQIASLSIANSSVIEGAEPIEFIVHLSKTLERNISFSYQTTSGSATSAIDYLDNPQTLTIAAGERQQTISVGIIDDPFIEDDETFDITISTTEPANELTISQASAIGTIKIDDLPSLSITDAIALEGKQMKFTVTLNPSFRSTEVSFNYQTLTSSASAADYTGVTANSMTTASILGGDTTTEIVIFIEDDDFVEDDETFDLVITNPTNATPDMISATGTIKIDDLPILSITDASALESERTMQFIVSLSAPFPGNIVSFGYQTIAGSASVGRDYYTSAFDATSIPADSTSISILIDISDDSLVEDDETFDLVIFSLVNATTGDIRATATIKIDDFPILSITDASAVENEKLIKFTVRLSEAFSRTDVFFDYKTSEDTALDTFDYTGDSGRTSIPAGSTSISILIDISDDSLVEDDERFLLVISKPVNAIIDENAASATGTIKIDDLPILSITDASALESERALQFRVSLSVPFPGNDVSFDYKTLAGSATATIDYTSVFDTTSIPADSTSISIVIGLIDDRFVEDDETFDLVISNTTNATPDMISATGTIKIDDLPILSITDASTLESESLEFTVTLSAPFPGNIVSFDYKTIAGSATATIDYKSVFGTASIPADSTSISILIDISDDALVEDDESFLLVISNTTNATPDMISATGTIKIDDLPILSITDASAVENEKLIKFTVRLSEAFPGNDVSFDYETVAVLDLKTGEFSAKNIIDYTRVSSRTSIPAGDTTTEISIIIEDDDLVEDDERFLLVISNPVNAIIDENAASATGTIKIDDLPSLSITDVSAFEDTRSIEFVVTLATISDSTTFFDYETLSGSGSASATIDYHAVSGAGTIAPRGNQTSIFITIVADDELELDESFDLEITYPSSNVVITRATATIKNDDFPTLSIAASSAEEDAGSMKFIVSLSAAFGNVAFDYHTEAGSATSGDDYTGVSATNPTRISVPANETEVVFSISIIDDIFTEGDESFDVIISNPVNATIDIARATGTIKDNDVPGLSIADATALEDAGVMEFVVSLDATFTFGDISFNYQTIDLTARGTINWSNQRASWSPREHHTSLVLQNKIWVLGGNSDIGLQNDVWYSTDGEHWSEAKTNDETGWEARSSHSSLAHQDKSWVLGGALTGETTTNDVWFSTSNTQLAYKDVSVNERYEWSPRESHTSVVFQNQMWTLGGALADGTTTNDVWTSINDENDKQWIDVGATNHWSPRKGHSSVVFDDKIWVLGGSAGSNYNNEVWDSTNGIAWTNLGATNHWSARKEHSSVVYGSRIWVLGGALADGTTTNDAWYSADGITWTPTTKFDDSGAGRQAHTSVVFDGRIWVLGGRTPTRITDSVSYISSFPDYQAVASMTGVIPQGAKQTKIAITLFENKIFQTTNKEFFVDIFNPVNAVIVRDPNNSAAITGRAEGTIVEDDLPILSIADASAIEADRQMEFIVTLTPASNIDVTFYYDTTDGTAQSISKDSDVPIDDRETVKKGFAKDYESQKGSSTIRAGDTTTSITISILDDSDIDNNETFDVIITKSTNATFDTDGSNKATGTIRSGFWREVTITGNKWSARLNHTSVVFKNKIWVLGGIGLKGLKNDVWSSDLSTWEHVQSRAAWSPRQEHSSVVYENKMWVLGGAIAATISASTDLVNDVWYSSDGITWTAATTDAAWSPRQGHSLVYFRDDMYVLGGADASHNASEGFDDMWQSRDGINWSKQQVGKSFTGNSRFAAVAFARSYIALLGGIAHTNSASNGNAFWRFRAPFTDWINVATDIGANPSGFSHFQYTDSVFLDVIGNSCLAARCGGVYYLIGGRSLFGITEKLRYIRTITVANVARWEDYDTDNLPLVANHTAVALDGKVYVIGGVEQGVGVTNKVWLLED